MTTPKPAERPTFPVLGSNTTVDYAMVADHGKQARANHYQSVQQLARRGGLSWAELYAVLHDREFGRISTAEAMLACRAHEAAYLAAVAPPPPPAPLLQQLTLAAQQLLKAAALLDQHPVEQSQTVTVAHLTHSMVAAYVPPQPKEPAP